MGRLVDRWMEGTKGLEGREDARRTICSLAREVPLVTCSASTTVQAPAKLFVGTFMTQPTSFSPHQWETSDAKRTACFLTRVCHPSAINQIHGQRLKGWLLVQHQIFSKKSEQMIHKELLRTSFVFSCCQCMLLSGGASYYRYIRATWGQGRSISAAKRTPSAVLFLSPVIKANDISS